MKKIKTKNNKISVFFGIVILIMGSIGTGIFFKNSEILSNSWNSLIIVIISWLFSSIGIFLLAFSLSRIVAEIKTSDLSIYGWVEHHNSKNISRTIKNYILLYYMPMIKFGVIFYAVIAFQNAIGWNDAKWWEIFLVIFLVITIIQFTGGTWIKTTRATNKLFIVTQMLPIIFVVIYGIYIISTKGIGAFNLFPDEELNPDISSSRPLLQFSPYIGIFSSIPSIYFVYDGFYKVASMQSDMKEPHKIKYVILFGMIALVMINIFLSIFLIVSFNGDFTSNENLLIVKITNWLIICSALGNFNLNAIMASRLYESCYFDKNKYHWVQKFLNFKSSNQSNPYNGSLLSYITTILYFIPCSIIGALLFFNSSGYTYGDNFTNSMYSFNDILINWSSVFIFIILLLPIMANFKKNNTKIKILDTFTIILITIPLVFLVFENLFNLGYMIFYQYWLDESKKIIFMSTVYKIILLFFNFSFIMLPLSFYKIKNKIKKTK